MVEEVGTVLTYLVGTVLCSISEVVTWKEGEFRSKANRI